MGDDDPIMVELARVLCCRVDDNWEFDCQSAAWLSLHSDIDIAAVLHAAADQLRAEADAYGPPADADLEDNVLRLVPRDTKGETMTEPPKPSDSKNVDNRERRTVSMDLRPKKCPDCGVERGEPCGFDADSDWCFRKLGMRTGLLLALNEMPKPPRSPGDERVIENIRAAQRLLLDDDLEAGEALNDADDGDDDDAA